MTTSPAPPPPLFRPYFCRRCHRLTAPAMVPGRANDRFTGYTAVCRHCGRILKLQAGKISPLHIEEAEEQEEDDL